MPAFNFATVAVNGIIQIMYNLGVAEGTLVYIRMYLGTCTRSATLVCGDRQAIRHAFVCVEYTIINLYNILSLEAIGVA